MQTFTARVIELIKSIPKGKVSTYGSIAAMAGNRKAARQVVRVLHTYSRKENLPWHRVISKNGTISLAQGQGYNMQKKLLTEEGVTFDENQHVNLSHHLWEPEKPKDS